MEHRLYWITQNLSDVPEADLWLSERERTRVAGMRFPKRRNDYKLGRWTAKQAICARLAGTAPPMSMVEIGAAEDGAPEVFIGEAPGLFSISISHSRDKGFCVIGPGDLAIGCDLEVIETREDSFFEDYFTPEEMSFCRMAQDAFRPLADYLVWSAKETALKILREGLRRDTRSVQIHVDPWEREDTWNSWNGCCRESSRVFHGWWRARDGFVYTMASGQRTLIPEELLIPR